MEISKTLLVTKREAWRRWLERHHAKEREIWLIYFKKHSGRVRIPYNDAVEEALCFGWIDSTVKRIDEDRVCQRFSPRRKGSQLSELNKERIRGLIRTGLMTEAGMKAISHHSIDDKFALPEDILAEIRKDEEAWKNFQKFPEHYKRIRTAFIDDSRERPEMFQRRLAYFLKMTKKNKRFGMMQ
ncbi:Bacteriocin-protection, YdeI or OmpD-Associated [uncultured archaeon]|nr:Bacteriocin-protection, YdeI or OmpD-Associated [uncultured archaeon]